MLDFTNAPSLERETEQFAVQLNANTLTVAMKEHHATIDSARSRVAPFLNDWEVDTNLAYWPDAFRFVYADGKVIDRNPSPPGSRNVVLLAGAANLTLTGQAVGLVQRRSYPPPPSQFIASADVMTMWRRFEGFQQGREPLTTMAYFCLTVFEFLGGGTDHGKRGRAAATFMIDEDVLKTLGGSSQRRATRRLRGSINQISSVSASQSKDGLRMLSKSSFAAWGKLRRASLRSHASR